VRTLGDIFPESQGKSSPADVLIADLADRQHGRVARRQLLALGIGAGAIDHRIATARLRPVYQGVYAVGNRLWTPAAEWSAAILACGADAWLSHRDAALLRSLARGQVGTRVDVTTTRRSRSGPRGVRLHRVHAIHPEDIDVVDGIPVTSVARTLLDLAGIWSDERLARAARRADERRELDLRAVQRMLERSKGRKGVRRLRRVMSIYMPDRGLLRSEVERDLLALCREWRLPLPATNVSVLPAARRRAPACRLLGHSRHGDAPT
jgi:hypothetical protein